MEERGEAADKMETHVELLKILEAVNRVSHDLPLSHESPDSDSSAIKALLELRTFSGSSMNPLEYSLSQHLSQLADSVQELHNTKPSRHGLKSFLTRRLRSHEVSRLAAEIESELHLLIDREIVSNLARTLAEVRYSSEDERKLLDEMSVFQERLSRGFNMNLQDMVLKSGIFSELEWVLCNPLLSTRVREEAAISIRDLVLFNKDVFVGSILVGGCVKALVSMGSLCCLQVLSSLIKAIKSPLVDEMESSGGVLKIVEFLSCDELEKRVMALDCVMEIGYYGRKEAVEVMMSGGLIKKLIELQRSEGGGGREMFGRYVARFAVQLEVGEGLRQREKRAFKQQILSEVREAGLSNAEAATILAEVLWGSSP